MKHLPKHLQPRWRYLAVEIESTPDAAFDREAFQRACWYAAGNLLGDPGSADADLSVLRFRRPDGLPDGADGSGRTGSHGAEATAVVRVRRGEVTRGRAALACVDRVDGAPVRTRVRGVGGTVRSCEEKYLKPPRGLFEERTVAFAGTDRPASTRGRRVDIELADGYAGATELDYPGPD